jgi:integrase
LTYPEAVRIVREQERTVLDKSYQELPIGREVKEFLRAKKHEGCAANTLLSYESTLARLARFYAFFDDLEPFADRVGGPGLVYDFLEHHWGESDEDTLFQRRSAVASFFEWAYRVDRVAANPFAKMGKRKRKHTREARRAAFPADLFPPFLSAQESLRDQAALLLLRRLALRREDLRLLQIGDIDLVRDEVHLRHGKGGKRSTLPLVFKDLRDGLYLHLLAGEWGADEYLLYPHRARRRPFSHAGIDLWFKRCLERAGIRGLTMHQLRHLAIDDVRRQTRDMEAARMLARHSSVKTTEEYLHSELDDLRAALLRMGEA